MTNNAVYVYDFTLGTEFALLEEVKTWITDLCKKWSFQREIGEETAWEHFQGRFSLKAKARLFTLKGKCPWPEIHLSPTSKMNQGNMFYVTKEETRIEGPWADTDPQPAYIPRHIRKITSLFPWQQTVINMIKEEEDTRIIHCILNERGDLGKSTFVTYCGVNGIAHCIPPLNTFLEIMQIIQNLSKIGCYLFDMPKAMDKKCLKGFYSAVETIKDGRAYDPRYHFKQDYFDIPNVFVFTNTHPDLSLLSNDRWRIWSINEALELVKWEPPVTPVQLPNLLYGDIPLTSVRITDPQQQQALDRYVYRPEPVTITTPSSGLSESTDSLYRF